MLSWRIYGCQGNQTLATALAHMVAIQLWQVLALVFHAEVRGLQECVELREEVETARTLRSGVRDLVRQTEW